MKTKMETLKIGLIDPNPYRDFRLHPVDIVRVDDIAASYVRHGDWGGITVRTHPVQHGRYQAAFGAHRMEGAKKAGIKELHVTIGAYSEQEMREMLITENATQQGMNAAATLEMVWVAARGIGIEALTDPRNLGSKRNQIREAILAGEGVGQTAIRKYPWQKKLSNYDIDAAVNQLRESGAWTDLLVALRGDMEALGETEVMAEIDKALSKPATKNDAPVFDRDVATEFENTAQVEAFRKSVTSEVGKQLLPVGKQKELARVVIKTATEARKNYHDKTRDISADSVERATNSEMSKGLFYRGNAEKKKHLIQQAAGAVFTRDVITQADRLSNGMAMAYSAALELQSLSKKGTVSIAGRQKTLTNIERFAELIPILTTYFSTSKDIDIE